LRDKGGTTLEAISATVALAFKAHLLCAWMCLLRCLIGFAAAQRPQATPQTLQKSLDRHGQQFSGAEKQKARSTERAS
jgi:hypothetical protein